MSSSFSANQYDNAFKSSRLQNWTVPKAYKEKPSSADGHTMFTATDRGHLLPGVKRGCPWTSFRGTWDLPKHIPPVHINPTARSQEGQQRLRAWGQVHRPVPPPTGNLTKTKKNNMSYKALCEGTSAYQQQGKNPLSTPAVDGPQLEMPILQASQRQSRPATQQSQPQSRPATTQSQAKSRPQSKASQT